MCLVWDYRNGAPIYDILTEPDAHKKRVCPTADEVHSFAGVLHLRIPALSIYPAAPARPCVGRLGSRK